MAIKDINYIPLLIKNITKLKKKSIQVGIIGSGQGELATYAAVNEFGSKNGNIPERSFLRRTLDNDGKMGKIYKQLDDVFDVDFALLKSLRIMAVRTRGAVQETIRSNVPPRNKPSTIERKKSSKTLIDTGTMLKSIEAKVV